METSRRGYLISIEGLDGSGKSSVAQCLEKKLKHQGNRVLLTKEPGGTELGKTLRNILHTQKAVVCDRAEFLLFAADRAQHFEQIIIPALDAGTLVISDRLADSSLAYQGYGRGLDHCIIRHVNEWAMHAMVPDVTIYLRIDPTTAVNRVRGRKEALTSFEQEARDFWLRVIEGYEKIFAERRNVITINALLPLPAVCEETFEKLTVALKSL